jgi:hypothetical protein
MKISGQRGGGEVSLDDNAGGVLATCAQGGATSAHSSNADTIRAGAQDSNPGRLIGLAPDTHTTQRVIEPENTSAAGPGG